MPPSATSNLPAPALHGPGEGALEVTEQLALDQLCRDRGAVHRHPRPGRPPRVKVQQPCHDLLASTVGTPDQDPGLAGRGQQQSAGAAPSPPGSCR